MFPKIVLHGQEAREKMLKGINTLADAVKVTLGPKGRNVAIGRKGHFPRLTKDGVSVAREIDLVDPVENFGANLIKGVAIKTCDTVGDGTTTATVLAQSIINQGMDYVKNGSNPMDLKRGIDLIVEKAVEFIRSKSIPITKPEEILSIATISSNGDSDIGKIIADTFSKIGKDGVIAIEESANGKTGSTVVEGLQLDSGYISPYFVTNPTKMIAELENPYILMYDKTISTLQPMMGLLESIVKGGDSLLIIAENVDAEALSTLVLNRQYKIVAIKSPSYGDLRKDILDDLIVMSGAKYISEETGINLKNVTKDKLGRAKKVIVSETKTTIVDGQGTKEEIDSRCFYLKETIEECDDPYKKLQLEERLAKLTNGVAVIRVGGLTELEMKERKDRVEDAVHATRAALQEGIVPGGGIALYRSSNPNTLLECQSGNTSISSGVNIMISSLRCPLNQILVNSGKAGEDLSSIVKEIGGSVDFSFGYDAHQEKFVDMIEAGIIDPTKVVVTALKDAASIGSLFLTTEALLVEDDEIVLNAIKNPLNQIRMG